VLELRVDEFENYIMENLNALLEECVGLCGDSEPPMLRLAEDIIYEGCDRCLIRAALDRVGVSTYSLTLRDGRFCELSRFDDGVIEVTDDTAELIPNEGISEYLDSLLSFGLISEEDAESILQWLGLGKK